MAQSSKRGMFASMFGSKKKTEEELEAERAFHRKLEERIREVLIMNDPPKLEPAMETHIALSNAEEIESVETVSPDTRGYSYLRPETPRKSPSSALYHPALRSLTAAASQSR